MGMALLKTPEQLPWPRILEANLHMHREVEVAAQGSSEAVSSDVEVVEPDIQSTSTKKEAVNVRKEWKTNVEMMKIGEDVAEVAVVAVEVVGVAGEYRLMVKVTPKNKRKSIQQQNQIKESRSTLKRTFNACVK